MYLSEPAVLLAALCLLIAGTSAGTTWAQARVRRTASQPAPTCVADPAISADLDASRRLVDQFDQAVLRHIDDVVAHGHDDRAIALLGVLDAAGIRRDQLGELSATLAWLVVYDDLHGDDRPEQWRRTRGLDRLATQDRRAIT